MKKNDEWMTKMNSLLGSTQNQEVKASGDTDINTSSHQEVNTSSEQEVKRPRHQDVKESGEQGLKSSRHLEAKKTREQESKESTSKDTGQDIKRSRVVDSDGIKRRPINITIREDYYRTIRLLAIDRNVQSWRLIDEALGIYLKQAGVDVYHSKCKK